MSHFLIDFLRRRVHAARRLYWLIAVCITAAVMMLAAGCAAPQYENPVGVITNREKELPQRRAAMQQAQERFADDPARIEALHKLIWERGHPNALRVLAIDQLVAYDEADFKAKAARRLGLLGSWEPLERIFEYAIERQWTDFTPAVVRNYARRAAGVEDGDRMERKVIAALNPGRSVEETVFAVFADADDTVPASEQTAAWELMCRITAHDELLSLIQRAPPRTPLVADLQACAKDMYTFPQNREGVIWLHFLRDPAQRGFWQAAARAVSELNADQRRGLELRHLPALVALNERAALKNRVLSADRATLFARVEAEVRSGELHLTGPTYDGPMDRYPQRIGHWRDALTWPDLVVISLVLDGLGDSTLTQAFFKQAQEDHLDKTTEYGGVLDISNGVMTAQLYEPLARRHDLKFIPRQEMVTHLYTGLAHYHFHAQSHRNGDYAGPGVGDLKLADSLNPSCLVLTFIDEDRLNVDYYQPGGAVVDLGTIRR